VLGHQGAEAVEDLAALRGRDPAPDREGHFGRPNCHRRVGRRPRLESADQVAAIGRVSALEGGAARRFGPLPGDEVAERGRFGCRGLRRRNRRRVGHRPPHATRSKAIATEPPPPRQRVARP
jgi:hypothetical protein